MDHPVSFNIILWVGLPRVWCTPERSSFEYQVLLKKQLLLTVTLINYACCSSLLLQELSQNWCPLSVGGLVMPFIGILTKRMYSLVHYLSNKHVWMFGRQLKLQLVFWKELRVPLQRTIGARRSRWKKWEECSMFRSMGSVRGKCLLHSRLKKIQKIPWSYLVEMTRTSSTVDPSSEQYSDTYSYACARVSWAPQHWSDKAVLYWASLIINTYGGVEMLVPWQIW